MQIFDRIIQSGKFYRRTIHSIPHEGEKQKYHNSKVLTPKIKYSKINT